MARVFQTFKTRTDPETGRRVFVRDKRGRKVAHECWRFEYVNEHGRRVSRTGYTSQKDTMGLALRLEGEARDIREGRREPVRSSHKHAPRAFEEVTGEYVAWGESQGGRGGRPWGRVHAKQRKAQLAWWGQELGLTVLGDLPGTLPRVEKALRDMEERGKAPKTLSNYTESLRAFCEWARQRGYLDRNPLAGMAGFDTTPKTTRRAMTEAEIHAFLARAAPHRRLLYEVAFCSGLRAAELRALRKDHLDVARGGLRLDSAWTKNRRGGFQNLPAALVAKLAAYAWTGDAAERYQRFYRQHESKHIDIPESPLLFVPRHLYRAFDEDLKAAGIPKRVPEQGKVDFHAARVAFINLVLASGADLKTAQAAARHSSPELTANVYGRSRPEALREVAESVGKLVLGARTEPETEAEPKRLAAGAENLTIIDAYEEGGSGSNPSPGTNSEETQAGQRESSSGHTPAHPGQSQEDALSDSDASVSHPGQSESHPGQAETETFTEPIRNRNGLPLRVQAGIAAHIDAGLLCEAQRAMRAAVKACEGSQGSTGGPDAQTRDSGNARTQDGDSDARP